MSQNEENRQKRKEEKMMRHSKTKKNVAVRAKRLTKTYFDSMKAFFDV